MFLSDSIFNLLLRHIISHSLTLSPSHPLSLLLFLFPPPPPQASHSSSRPTPHDIVLALMENEETVLRIPSDDAGTHSMAATLGAPLEAGDNMYRDLQGLYYSLQTQS